MSVKSKNQNVNKKHQIFNIVSVVFAVAANAGVLAALNIIQKYSSFSQFLFVIVNVVALLLLLIVNLLAVIQQTSKKNSYAIAVIVLSVVLAGVSGAGIYFGSRIQQTVDKIIVNGSITESLELAVVVNQDSDESYTALSELGQKKIGIVQQVLNEDIYLASKAEFEDNNITVELVEYEGYQEIILALLKGEVDAGVLPSNYDYMFASESEDDYMESLVTLHKYSREIVVESTSTEAIDVTKEPFNVLLIGMDESHSDVLMVATFNPVAFEVTYTSIPRDSYVPICGNSEQKIGHSRNYGRACTIQTVEDLMDIKIDYFFEVNFFGVVSMVDALGGIPIDSPVEFVGQTASYDRGTKTVKIFKGLHNCNGEQVLAFARERKIFAAGDFQRGLNQQQVITSFLGELVRVRDVNVALNVLDAAGENLRTNMPIETMIELFNVVLKKVDRSYEKGFSALDIKSSRLTGYSSSKYDEGSEINLYIYKLFNGSIEENRNLILGNTDLEDQTISEIAPIKWSANWEYDAPIIYHEYFNEPQYHEPTPDLVGNWVDKNISELKKWASDRGIALNIIDIEEGNSLYDASKANGTILTQSERSGRLSKNISSLTVSVMKVVPKVPDFSTFKKADIKNIDWKNDYGFTVKTVYMKSHDASGAANPSYVYDKVGAFVSQSVNAGQKSDGTFSEVVVTYYDYPYVVSAIPSASDGLEAIKSWAQTNLKDSEEKIVYVEEKITHDETQDGKVAAVSAVLDGEPFVKTNGKLSVQLYKYEEEPAIEIPSFIGKSVNDLMNWAAAYGVTATGSQSETACGEDGAVVILTFAGLDGITSIKPSELAGKTVSYSYCVVVVPEPEPTPSVPETEPETESGQEQTPANPEGE